MPVIQWLSEYISFFGHPFRQNLEGLEGCIVGVTRGVGLVLRNDSL